MPTRARSTDVGVTLVPGTDVGINFTDFGEDLFIELEAWVGVGMDPGDVIHYATGRAAWHLGIEGETGHPAAGPRRPTS